MAAGDPLSISFDLPFDRALAEAQKRAVLLPEEFYTQIPAATRRLAWTASNLAGIDQVTEVFTALNEALASGQTIDEWRAAALETDWGLSAARLDLIFRAQVQTAYMAGHVQAFEDNSAERPYLMYTAINDNRTRPAHAALSGYIAQIDDPFWLTHTPPLGYNCRCSIVSLTPDQADSRGFGNQIPRNVPPDEGGWGTSPKYAQSVIDGLLNDALIDAPQPVQTEVVQNIIDANRRPSG